MSAGNIGRQSDEKNVQDKSEKKLHNRFMTLIILALLSLIAFFVLHLISIKVFE